MSNKLKIIFNKNYAALCNYAASRVMDKHAAEDIVQSVFIQLWENDKILNLENPDTYLLKCVRFKCIDHLRSQKRKLETSQEKLPEIGHEEQQTLKEEDILPLLHYFASKLPPKTQRVFLMSRQQGMTYKEIAQELNISIKTIENQMGTALRKLRILLKEHHYLPVSIAILQNIFIS